MVLLLRPENQSYGFRIPVLPFSLSRNVETKYRPNKNALIECIFGGTEGVRTPVHYAFATKDTLSGLVQQFFITYTYEYFLAYDKLQHNPAFRYPNELTGSKTH